MKLNDNISDKNKKLNFPVAILRDSNESFENILIAADSRGEFNPNSAHEGR